MNLGNLEIVSPLALQYYGKIKICYSINNGCINGDRIDHVKSLEVTKYIITNTVPKIQTEVKTFDTCIIHFLTLKDCRLVYDKFIRHFESANRLSRTDEYIELQLEIARCITIITTNCISYFTLCIYIQTNPVLRINSTIIYTPLLNIDFVEPEGYIKSEN